MIAEDEFDVLRSGHEEVNGGEMALRRSVVCNKVYL